MENFKVLRVKIKSLDDMMTEYGHDYLGVKTEPRFNVFMESWLPESRRINVIPIPNSEQYLMGTLHGEPYYISNQHIEEILCLLN